MIATAVARDPMTMPRRRCLIISISEQLTNDLSSLTKYERLVPLSVLHLLIIIFILLLVRTQSFLPGRAICTPCCVSRGHEYIPPDSGLFVIAQFRGIRIRIVVHIKRRLYTRGHAEISCMRARTRKSHRDFSRFSSRISSLRKVTKLRIYFILNHLLKYLIFCFTSKK